MFQYPSLFLEGVLIMWYFWKEYFSNRYFLVRFHSTVPVSGGITSGDSHFIEALPVGSGHVIHIFPGIVAINEAILY